MKAAQAVAPVSFRNILFLTDFSEPSEAALPFAVGIARAYGSKVFALHVLQAEPLLYSTPPSAIEAQEAQEDTAKVNMERLGAQLTGIPYETAIEWGGTVWPTVEQSIKRRLVDLIVLGTHGRTGVDKILLGSVAEEIFRRSSVPVLTIGPEVRSGVHSAARFRTVIFPTDFSSHSLAALPYALSLAEENQARLVLFHVTTKKRLPGEAMQEQDDLKANLAGLVPEEAKLWCEAEAIIENDGEPAARILDLAKQRNAELIVMGVKDAQKHIGAESRLARTVAHHVIARAQCPVLTVRA